MPMPMRMPRCRCRDFQMAINSVKEINRLRKEVNRLLSKRMSNIYLKVAIEKN